MELGGTGVSKAIVSFEGEEKRETGQDYWISVTGFTGISETEMCVCVHVHMLCNAYRRSEALGHT